VLGRFSPPAAGGLATLAACAAAGLLGLLPGVAGGFDPVNALGWMALCAPAAGALCGARGLAQFPFSLSVPAVWVLVLTLVEARAERGFPTPSWAACALGGLFASGHAVGARMHAPFRSPLVAAGALFYLGLVLAGASQGFGLVAGGTELARTHPWVAARLLDASPLVLVFDCAGWDWTHAQPEVYAGAGVEWFQRRAYPGNLAGPAVLVVGCALALLARRPHARGLPDPRAR